MATWGFTTKEEGDLEDLTMGAILKVDSTYH